MAKLSALILGALLATSASADFQMLNIESMTSDHLGVTATS
jgi:hypothetical protein